jgi:hypothetical protein
LRKSRRKKICNERSKTIFCRNTNAAEKGKEGKDGQRNRFCRSSIPLLLLILLELLFLGVNPENGQAQSQMALSFSRALGPQLGQMKPMVNFQVTPYQEEPVTGQSKDIRVAHYQASLLVPLYHDRNEELSLIGNFRGQHIQTEAVLPDSHRRFPDGLWDVRLGPSYRHKFENDWIGGAFLTLGSASDRLFASWRESELQGLFFARIPSGKRNAWIVMMAYSNNREFLNNVPIPGIAFWYEPSDRYRLLIGFPFAFFEFKPYPDLSMELTYFAVRSVRSRITYRLFRPLWIYAGFDWRNEGYFLAERQDQWDRFFYYEKRLYGGVRWDLWNQLSLDLIYGYSFDRFYFEGRDYEDRNRDRVDVGNGPFLSILVGMRF